MIYHGWIQGKPIPQGSKTAVVRNGKAVMFEANKKHKAYRQMLEKIFSSCTPTSSPVRVELVFTFEQPKTVTRLFPSVKPDIDKLSRTILDAASGHLFVDDAQVIILNARKHYGPADGVLVRVFEITEITIP